MKLKSHIRKKMFAGLTGQKGELCCLSRKTQFSYFFRQSSENVEFFRLRRFFNFPESFLNFYALLVNKVLVPSKSILKTLSNAEKKFGCIDSYNQLQFQGVESDKRDK